MTRIIRIETCDQCPSRDHKGGFGHISYVPICRAVGKELPFTVSTSIALAGPRVSASATNEIPDWCPLERIE